MSEQDRLSVLVVEPDKIPYFKEIDSDLESLQREVGGYIEVVYPFDDPVGVVGDEEGKLKGKPLNRALRDADGDIYDIMAGTFLVVGLGEDNFCSLSNELGKKYMEHYKYPEEFFKAGEKIISVQRILADSLSDDFPEKRVSLDEQIKSAEQAKEEQGSIHDSVSKPEFDR